MTPRRLLLLALCCAPLAACAGTESSGVDPSVTHAGESGPGGEGAEATPTPDERPHLGGQTGGEAGIRCSADVALEPIAQDATTSLGYSPADVMAGLPTQQQVTLNYPDGAMTALDVSLTYDGPVAFAAGCNRIELDVTLGFTSSDGAFSEQLHGRLFASSPESATLSIEVPAEALVGNYVSSHAATLPAGPLSLSFEFEFVSDMLHGSVEATPSAADAGDSQFIANF